MGTFQLPQQAKPFCQEESKRFSIDGGSGWGAPPFNFCWRWLKFSNFPLAMSLLWEMLTSCVLLFLPWLCRLVDSSQLSLRTAEFLLLLMSSFWTKDILVFCESWGMLNTELLKRHKDERRELYISSNGQPVNFFIYYGLEQNILKMISIITYRVQ